MGPLQGEDELTQLGAIVGWAFGSTEAKATQGLRRGGVDNVKVTRDGARVIAGLLEIPMGQWFRGRSVPMLGVAGVAVAPDARGRGVALSLMKGALQRRAGVLTADAATLRSLSLLFGGTPPAMVDYF
jgi:predicted acetyltransferase